MLIKIQLRFVVNGDYVHLKNDENSPLWIRGRYIRSSKTYSLISYNDTSQEIFRRASSYVYIEN